MSTKNAKISKNNEHNKKCIKTTELPLSNPHYNQNNFKEFCKLETDWNVKSIDRNDLPEEFSKETCKFIDIFRRKTVDEKTEWNFYIDYKNNEIIHCFHGNATKVSGKINIELMKNKKILSVHNHPKGTYSAPSASNFDILENDFENYEIICAENEFWILESKNKCPKKHVEKFKTKIETIFQNAVIKSNNPNKDYSIQLCEYINSSNNNIKLINRKYR